MLMPGHEPLRNSERHGGFANPTCADDREEAVLQRQAGERGHAVRAANQPRQGCRQIVAAVNLGPRRIGGFISDVLVLGVPDEAGRVVLLGPEREVPIGGKVF